MNSDNKENTASDETISSTKCDPQGPHSTRKSILMAFDPLYVASTDNGGTSPTETKSKKELLIEENHKLKWEIFYIEKKLRAINIKSEMDELIKLLELKQKRFLELRQNFDKTVMQQAQDLAALHQKKTVSDIHLESLEKSFNDLLKKYEQAKSLIVGLKSNETILKEKTLEAETIFKSNEEKYDQLKLHYKKEIEEANRTRIESRDSYEFTLAKLRSLIRRFEIKNETMSTELESKKKECNSLAKLVDCIQNKTTNTKI